MLKVIDLADGKQISLRSSAATAIIYKNQFGRDFFADMMRLAKVFDSLQEVPDDEKGETDDHKANVDISKLSYEDLDHLNLDTLYQVVWALAKNADANIPDLQNWLMQFDEFPLSEIMEVVMELLNNLFKSSKK